MEVDVYSKLDEDGAKKMIYKMARDRDENYNDVKGGTVIKDRKVSDRTRGSAECLGKLLQGATEPGRK